MVTWVTQEICVPLRYVPMQEDLQDRYQLTLPKYSSKIISFHVNLKNGH